MNFKKLFAASASLLIFGTSLSFAAEKADTTGIDSVEEWHIGMVPPPSARQLEAARWAPLLKNEIGVYDYEKASVKPEETDGDVVTINLKVSDIKPDLLVKLNAHYAEKTGNGKIAGMEKLLAFNRKYNTYSTLRTVLFNAGGEIIDDTGRQPVSEAKFHLIPEGSVAEAALEKIVEITGK